MNRTLVAALVSLAMFVAGGLAYRHFSEPPRAMNVVENRSTWQLPGVRTIAMGNSQEVWARSRPLGSAPVPPPPPPAPAPALPPPAVPAGVVKGTDGLLRALFRDPAMGEVSYLPGQPMVGGGRVLRITADSVEWVDAQDRRFRHVMLFDVPPFNTYSQGLAPVARPAPVRPGARRGNGR